MKFTVLKFREWMPMVQLASMSIGGCPEPKKGERHSAVQMEMQGKNSKTETIQQSKSKKQRASQLKNKIKGLYLEDGVIVFTVEVNPGMFLGPGDLTLVRVSFCSDVWLDKEILGRCGSVVLGQ